VNPSRIRRSRGTWLLLPLALSTACSAPKPSPDILSPTEEQTKLRAFQSRTLDVTDRLVALRAVMAVLQDLGFIIERANEPLGLVTGARFAEPNFHDIVGVTVTVRQSGEGKMLVRINAIHNNRPVTEAEPYQKFFAALEKSLFLTGNTDNTGAPGGTGKTSGTGG
jgi:hypothetical protein